MPELSTLSDDDLLRRMIAGDEEAFTALYRRRQGAVYRFALQMSGSPTVAEEVTQEVFLVLIRQAGQFDSSRGSLTSYLYGIARNHVLRCLDRDRPYVPIANEETSDEPDPAAGLIAREDPLHDLTQAEQSEAIRRAILALPPRYREAVVLCDLEELSYSEAARAAGTAVGTIRSRLHRARALLLKKLGTTQPADSSAKQTKSARCTT